MSASGAVALTRPRNPRGRRGMAQLGSASALGAEGRRFESGYPDPAPGGCRGGRCRRSGYDGERPVAVRSRTRARIPSPPEQTPQESNAVKSAVETLNPTRVKLTVEVPFDELKPSLDAAYTSISKQVTVPGFRKGHVPPRIIDQRFGRAVVLEEAVNEALPRFYGQAIEENSIEVVGRPEVEVTEIEDGQHLK